MRNIMKTITCKTHILTYFVLILLLISTEVSANTYYVAKNGNDNNSGTEAQPWLTIQKAADTMIAGDIAYVKEGVYKEQVVPKNSGRKGNYITYQAYPRQEVIVESPNSWFNRYCILLSKDKKLTHLRFSGLKLRNSNWVNFGVLASDSGVKSNIILDGLTIESGYIGIYFRSGVVDSKIINCEIHYNQFGIYLDERNRDILIDNNHVSHGKIVGQNQSKWSHNICVYSDTGDVGSINTNITITNNHVHHALVQGILVWHGEKILIKGNHSHHNGATGIQIESAGRPDQITKNIVVEDNLCEYNSQHYDSETGIWVDDSDRVVVQNNIARFNEVGLKITGSFQVIARKNLIYHNYHNEYINSGGIYVLGTEQRQSGGDNIIVHNTFFENAERSQRAQIVIGMWSSQPPLNRVVFKNNIASESRALDYRLDLWIQGLTHTLDYNNYFNSERNLRIRWQGSGVTPISWSEYLSTSNQDNHSITSDPLFIDTVNSDYHLKPDSPCIDRGGFLTETASSGVGTEIQVKDARYFTDGYGLVDGDIIQVGSNDPVRIVRIDYSTNTIFIDKSISWNSQESVSYPFIGSASDIGAFEYVPNNPPNSPSNLKQTNYIP